MPATAADVDGHSSPFAAAANTAAVSSHGQQSPLSSAPASGTISDADAAAITAAEGGDDLTALPDAGGRTTSTTAAAAGFKGLGSAQDADDMSRRAFSGRPRRKKMIPLKRVMRDTYEYHGLNDLCFFCITALAVTLVLYWHWGTTTATFKANVQSSFQQYGNPDWQGNSLSGVGTMYDAVEYAVGWMEFWLSRAENTDWPNNGVRVGEFADIKYMRLLVNLERNCELRSDMLAPGILCYSDDDELTKALRAGNYTGRKYDGVLAWAGWQDVGKLAGRDAADTGNATSNHWWSYPVLAPKFHGEPSKLDNYVGRMYNVTRNTNLNYNNCDWAASECKDMEFTAQGNTGPICAKGGQVPFQDWWASKDMCNTSTTTDIIPNDGRFVRRGQRSFVRDPRVTATEKPEGVSTVLDLKPFLSKYAYSINVEVLATNAASQPATLKANSPPADMALFNMAIQRSGYMKDKPDRIIWQITTTLPVRTTFYGQVTDITRIFFEVVMHLCLLVVLYLQVWQMIVCSKQHWSRKAWVSHWWNVYELLSNVTLLAWVIFYWVLVGKLAFLKWTMPDWDVDGEGGVIATRSLNNITWWSGLYSNWLYMGIVVDFLICLRLTRYMRIHVGLKAFYQVFIIAAREFLDFAVFLFYILVLLGSAVFAFFQLTGGNYQFLRFPDGLSLMTRLTFGFLSYEEFQSQALGVGAAIYAVTGLFWIAVLLLVVYTQNIILAIVAEAYEEAKAKLGTAKTSFLLLVLMRIIFTFLFIIYRIRMLFRDMMYACTGAERFNNYGPGSFKRVTSTGRSGVTLSDSDLGPGPDDAPGPGPGRSGPGDQGSAPDLGAFGSARGLGQWGTDEDDVLPGPDDAGFALAPTLSRAVLPFDVEKGLAGSYTSRAYGGSGTTSSASASRLLSSFARRTSSQANSDAAAGGSANGLARDAAASAGLVHSDDLLDGPNRSFRGFVGPAEHRGVRRRLSHIWHDIILGERHTLRMYNDVYLAPGASEDSWVTSWKTNYWRPWCVARTFPLRCLMNLYQDFTSYKLKEECTWLANTKARQVIASTWHGGELQSQLGLKETGSGVSGGSGSNNSNKDLAADAGADAGDRVSVALPLLAEEAWVTEDELARLFLVTSEMSTVLNVWHSPFEKLTLKEVSYLVKGVAEVYGQDEDEWRRERQALLGGGSDDAGMQGGGGLVTSPSMSSLKDARLGSGSAPSRKGGFISSLNQKRRDGGVEQGRQVSLLLHANKRVEELTNKNASQLSSQRESLRKHMEASTSFQRSQRDTNEKLLKGLQDLQRLMQSAQQPQHSASFAGMGADRAGSGAGAGLSSPLAAGTSMSATRRFNSMAAAVTATGRMLGGKGGRSSKVAAVPQAAQDSAHAGADAAGLGGFAADGQLGSDLDDHVGAVSPRATTAAGPASSAAGAGQATMPAAQDPADSAQLVASLQQQLEQQQRALQLQQELLQQVLARLPPPTQQ